MSLNFDDQLIVQVMAAPPQQEGPPASWGLSVLEFAWSPCVCMGCLRLLWLSPTVQCQLGSAQAPGNPDKDKQLWKIEGWMFKSLLS